MTAGIAACIFAATPGIATPLEFAGMNATTTFGDSHELDCTAFAPDPFCALRRDQFSNVPITSSLVMFSEKTRKLQAIAIFIDPLYEDKAIEALTAKYGKPTSDKITPQLNETGGPYDKRLVRWQVFNVGEEVFLLRTEDLVHVNVNFKQNLDPDAAPNIDF
jgi:hypothetical protein